MAKAQLSRTGLRSPLAHGLMILALGALALVWAPEAPGASTRHRTAHTDSDTAASESTTVAPRTSNTGLHTRTLTLHDMGVWGAIRLKGVDGARYLSFPIRSDEVVVSARLRLAYDYSPALIPELSHLMVVLNDKVVDVIPLPRDKPVGTVRDLDIDPRLFRGSNEIQFKLIGHYAKECEDADHSSLWLQLSDLGRLELTLATVPQSADLRKLPNPFFDPRDLSQLSVPMVFANTPGLPTLQAAGIVASWFGAQAPGRGVQFPAQIGELPPGHAVVFLQGGESIAGVRANPAASVSIVPHPFNPKAQLLVISGSDGADQLRAARALALDAAAFSGTYVAVGKDVSSAQRKPYDAPAWLPSDRPVRLGELAPPTALQVHAYYPDAIRLNLRLPPDTYLWHNEGADFDLRLRSVRLPEQRNSSLDISVNNAFVQSFALDDTPLTGSGARMVPRRENLHLPAALLQGRTQLAMTYYFDVLRRGTCLNLPPNNLEGAIDPESTLDISHFPHYAALPNLASFASLGFPYTRLADLSETAVLLSANAGTDELNLYLAVMGRMGESTGYPAVRVTVATPETLDTVAGKDLIAIQSGPNQSLMTRWKDAMPLVTVNGERQLHEPRDRMRLQYRWAEEDLLPPYTDAGTVHLSSGNGLAMLMGFESPISSGRSVVYFYADRPADLRKMTDLITDFDRLPSIMGDFVFVDDKSIQHARVAATYYVGSLPWWSRVRWLLSDQPLVLALLTLVVVFALGLLAYRPLRRRLEKSGQEAST